jgi:hypothetical protein
MLWFDDHGLNGCARRRGRSDNFRAADLSSEDGYKTTKYLSHHPIGYLTPKNFHIQLRN